MSTKLVIRRIDELLKPLGFSRRNAVWNRKSDSFIDVIALEKSKFGDTVTISAGVVHPEIHRRCWKTELPAIVQEPDCIVRARVGHLLGGKDLWWRLDEPGMLDDIAEKISTAVLSFLNQMHSLEAMEQFLTNSQVTKQKYPPPVIYLAILKSERGDRTGACALLTELGAKSVQVWQNRVRAVAETLGCS